MANKNKTIVIGVGRLGSGIANRAAAKGQDVIVVDPNPKAFYSLDDTFSGFKVNSDSTDMFALEEHCDIKTAGQVVIVTGDDNVNLFLAYVCSLVYAVPRITVRFDDPDKGALVEGLPNVKAIYPFDLTLVKYNEIEQDERK
ncbi:MAG: TrkA family potassium uptake protein [Bacilli bacterium]|nr:TrkA family potassium uptake protein [Bacilli bacterium]MBR5990765.1 TrkA family potassium uptake protein [Bacilli bacterium]